MASKLSRWWTAFVGGRSALLGVGLATHGLKINSDKEIFKNSLCESQYGENDVTVSLAKDKQEIHYPDIFGQSKSNNKILIDKAKSLIQRFKEECGSPGLAISVSVNGKTVWSEGFGYSDVENDVPCTPDTVMRIASISKPLTATAIMKLVDEGKVNLDDPVQKYVPSFPEKQINSKPCVITIRQLLCHKAGIRHYKVKGQTRNGEKIEERDKKTPEQMIPECYIKDFYDSVEKSLSLFKNDPLVHEPGSKFLYTTYGWTLLSAVVEGATGKTFLQYMHQLFNDLGMNNTQAELHKNLVYGRTRHYARNEKGVLINTPYVDNSYKWAGGGFISTTEDLIKFGNAILYSGQIAEYRGTNRDVLPSGIVSPESMRISWTNTIGEEDEEWGYGLGWIIQLEKYEYGCCNDQKMSICHNGGAVGASSILLIQPKPIKKNIEDVAPGVPPPNGIVVAILVNMDLVDLMKPALNIAKLFTS